jgi:hypothetical protein
LIEIKTKDIPPEIHFFIEKKNVDDMMDPLVLDYFEEGPIQQVIIPAICEPLSQFDFYFPS